MLRSWEAGMSDALGKRWPDSNSGLSGERFQPRVACSALAYRPTADEAVEAR